MKTRLIHLLLISMLAVVVPSLVAQTKSTDAARSALAGDTLNSRAVNLIEPEHPARARGMHGTVQVRVVIDKKGEVTAAQAMSGPTVFYAAAEQAARKSKFTPGPVALRLAYAFDDHIQERCSDRDLQFFDVQERHADSAFELLTFSRGTRSLSLAATLRIAFLNTGEIGEVEVVKESSKGHEQTLLGLAHHISFVPTCSNGEWMTVTRMVDFDEYGFRLRKP